MPALGSSPEAPCTTREVPDALRETLLAQWNALGEEVFSGQLEGERKLSSLGRDCEVLATVWTWFRTGGNTTKAAERLNSSRRTLRERIRRWRGTYPDLVPVAVKKTSAPKARGAEDEASNHEQRQGPDEPEHTPSAPTKMDAP
ncbi:MAG: helix-turn-helix domain-containing protein [Nannocystaceae bacterium]